MTSIYKDAMLNNIVHQNCNSIKFEFYNAETGEDLESVVCKGISLFKYSSTLLATEETFPYFVLDITYEKMDKVGAMTYLKNNKFSFYQVNGDPTIGESETYYIFKAQGGAIDILVICLEVEKTKYDLREPS